LAISYVGVGTAATSAGGTTGSVTPTLPSGLQANDLMIIMVTGRGNHSFATPTGWTQKFQEQLYPTDNLHKLAIFYKFYVAGDGNPVVSWTGGGTNQTVIAQVFAFRGVDTTNPIPDLGPNSGNASAQNIGPITGFTPTGAGNDGCVIVIGHKADDWTSVATLTGDGLTWNEIAEPDTTSGNDAGQVYDYALYSGSPPTITAKTFTVTGGAANTGAGKMISLKAKTAVTIEIELFEPAISFSDSLTRQPSRPLSEPAVSIPEESLVRAVQRALSEASISIPAETLTRLVSRALSEPALSFSDALEKSVQRNISLDEAAVSIAAEILAREVRRTLSEAAVSIPAETLIRFISRALSEPSISFSDSLARQVLRLLAEPTVSIPAETLRREINRALSEASVSIPQELLARYISRALSEPSQAFSDSLAREAQRILSEVAISASDALAREVQRALLEPSIPFSDSLIRMVSVFLSETSLTFSDDIEIEVVPGGPPPPAGKRVKVHVWPVTPVHTPKVM